MPVTNGPYFYDGRLLLGTNIPLTNETPPPHSLVIGSHNGNAVYSEGNISMISGNFVVGALSCSSNNYQMEINGNVNVTGSYFQNGLPILTIVGGKRGGNTSLIGSVVHFPEHSLLPEGYLRCNGQAVSRSIYNHLFDEIGTLYGPGDGSTTFNIPYLANSIIKSIPTGEELIEVGIIMAWDWQAEIPNGYLRCDGSSVSKTEFSNLYNVIGEQYTLDTLPYSFRLPYFYNHIIRYESVGRTPVTIGMFFRKGWSSSGYPPDKYLRCNGISISRETYNELYAIIGDRYGAGDGATTFNLPFFYDYIIKVTDTDGLTGFVTLTSDEALIESATIDTLQVSTNLLAPNVARVWAHFSLTDNVIFIYDSYNVSSIDYNGSGIFTISFSESLSSANYAFIGSVGYEAGDDKPYIVQEATHQPNYRTTNKIIVIIPGLVGSRTRISVTIF